MRTGVDLVHIPRFQKILARTPATKRRIFLPQEARDATREELAGTFAAKEAVMKALGIAAGNWQRIEIKRQKKGKPFFLLHGFPKPRACDLSIAHDGDYVFAVVCCSEKS